MMTATKTVRRGWLPRAVLCAFGLTFLAGWGVKRVPASGKVTLDDQPLNAGVLVFPPDASKGNKSYISCTSPVKEGRYELQTHGVTRSDSGGGVPPGWYKV